MTGTQAALYAEIDLELSWSESELPQSERTKHVHGLHPYLGKFPPQLAEALIRRHCPAGRPRAGPVLRLGHDARGGRRARPRRRGLRHLGLQRAALAREDATSTTPPQSLPGLAETLARAESLASEAPGDVPAYLAEWYGEEARRELLAYRRAIEPDTAWAGSPRSC